jgi:glycine cleavage system pyridoxal-binding protein P
MVCDLTGMGTANAGMLDEASAAAEAMLMARRVSGSESNVFLVDVDVFPQTRAVLETRAEPIGVTLKFVDFAAGDAVDGVKDGAFGALIQNPGSSGRIRDISVDIAADKNVGGVVVVASDLLALNLLSRPDRRVRKSSSARLSASVSLSVLAGPTRRSSPWPRASSDRCPDGSSVCRVTLTVDPPIA